MPVLDPTASELSDVDPFSDAFLTDPYPTHERMREAAPIVWLERYRVWAMARHDEVNAALRDPESFCSRRGVGLADFAREPPWRPPSLLLEADPPDHTRARQAITAALTPRAVRAMDDAFEREATRLAESLVEQGTFDGIADLAEPFPLAVLPDEIGLPREGRHNLLPYGNMAFNAFGPRNARCEAALARGAAVAEWVTACTRRDSLAPGGLGVRIHDAAAAAGFSEAEGELLVRSVLTAGIDTTVHAIGNALLLFAEHPDQWDALRQDPARFSRGAFEEAVRLESPVQIFFRTTTRTVQVGDVELGEGEKVILFLAAANRDPRHWPDPDRFDIRRGASGNVGFGAGIHVCVGRALARLEGEVILRALAERVERIELAGEPRRQLNNTLRGLDALPLRAR